MPMQPPRPKPLASPAADTAFAGERSGFAFAGYVFDMRRDRLTKDGVPVVLAPKPRALLRYFLSNPERVVDKRELITAVWASTVVTDDSLVQCVVEIRRALHDNRKQVVRTMPRRGYLLIVDAADSKSREARTVEARRLTVAIGAIVVAAVLVWQFASPSADLTRRE